MHVRTPTVVLILCAMRTGSTLLKALLAQAPDVSHLPEVHPASLPRTPIAFYRALRGLSDRRILILKKPAYYPRDVYPPELPDFVRPRSIVLVRDLVPTIRSLSQAPGRTEEPAVALAAYWKTVYGLLQPVARNSQRTRLVRYEDLTRDPIAVTRGLFQFMGSHKAEGVSSYDSPESFQWTWGTDDGGDVIRSLRVQPGAGTSADNALLALQDDPTTAALRAFYGYGPQPGLG